mmetsp:Transcript_12490/g.40311  ORF Transcript_12490/g.40311 Transcript_12490/m.40311 type:complete len:252 (+) Transcript_12490:186-941(+)
MGVADGARSPRERCSCSMARASAARNEGRSGAVPSAAGGGRKRACARNGSLRSARPERPPQRAARACSMSEWRGAGERPPSSKPCSTSKPGGCGGTSGCSAAQGSSGSNIARAFARRSSPMQEERMAYLATAPGGPTYCLMSARSMKAASTAAGKLEVVRTIAFGKRLSWSSCVSSALTTRTASEGSFEPIAESRARVSDSTSSISTQTSASPSSSSSVMRANIPCTILPDSENHFEKSECAFTSTRCACG